MTARKWNVLLIVFSLIGGGIGFFVGEALLRSWEGMIHPTLLMGIYFGQFAFFVGLFCLLAETISPELNGRSWKQKYLGDGWKLLVPATVVLLFVSGVILQFIYGLTFVNQRPADDFVLAIDVSGSMNDTDPGYRSMEAANNLLQRMDSSQRGALILFNHEANAILPLSEMSDAVKKQAGDAIAAIILRDGGTDIGLALEAAARQLTDNAVQGRAGSVILLSDGYSEVDYSAGLQPFITRDVQVHTIGMLHYRDEGTRILKTIADETNGTYHHVDKADDIGMAMDKIYANQFDSHLVGERLGTLGDSISKAILRVFFIAIIGALLGLSLGIVFDNRHLAKSFIIGGAVAGLLAGLWLESGMKGMADPGFLRLVADLILAAVLSLSTVVVGVRSSGNTTSADDTTFRRPVRAGSSFDKSSNQSGGRFGL